MRLCSRLGKWTCLRYGRGAAASSDALFLRFIGAPARELAPPNPLIMPARTLEDAYADADAYNPDSHFDTVDRRADISLLTPLVRALDSLTTPGRADRAVRDPVAPVAIGGAETATALSGTPN